MGKINFNKFILSFIGFCLWGTTQNAFAIPAFSRITKAKCSSCHETPTWQLNENGLSFLKNGHREDYKTYDSNKMDLENYMSFVWKGRAYNNDIKTTPESTSSVPNTQLEQHSFSLYIGGPIAENFSFFTEMYLSENTNNTSKTTTDYYAADGARKKLAEAFLQYNIEVGEDKFVAIRAGEILPEIIHTFGVGSRSIEQRAMVFNDKANAANPYKIFTRSQGMDVKYNSEMIEAALGIVNGAANATNAIDTNNNKDYYLTLQGNIGHTGSAVGLYSYNGKYPVYATQDDPTTALSYNNVFTKTGILGRYVAVDWRAVLVYFTGKETINAAEATSENVGYSALVDYNFSSDFGIAGRYEMLDPNKDTSDNESTMSTFSLNGLLFQHEKSGARWSLDFSDKLTKTSATTDVKTKKVIAQLTWAY